MQTLSGISQRKLTWHSICDVRNDYMRSNARHAGRYYQHVLNISSYFLDTEEYDQDAIDYLINNHQIRERDCILAEHKKLGFEWEEIGPCLFKLKNYTIKLAHYDNVVTQYIPCGSASFIEQYHARNIEDAFQFVIESVKSAKAT